MALATDMAAEIGIPLAAAAGILFALLQWFLVSRVSISVDSEVNDDLMHDEEEFLDQQAIVTRCAEIQSAISVGELKNFTFSKLKDILSSSSSMETGATSFLYTEYRYLSVFMAVFSVVIFLFLASVKSFSKAALSTAALTAAAYLLGAVTSVLSGFLGMKIATYANARTTLEARKGVGKAFVMAFRCGAVMGFLLAANGLLVLYFSIKAFGLYFGDDWESLYESITGYGLGGSSMALFGRVGGGIYTKAADVGADLVGKIEKNIPEDDPRNPAVKVEIFLCSFSS